MCDCYICWPGNTEVSPHLPTPHFGNVQQLALHLKTFCRLPKISIWQLQISHIHRTTIKRGRTLAVVILAYRSRNGWGVLDSWSICDLSQLTSTLGQIAKTPQPFEVTFFIWTLFTTKALKLEIFEISASMPKPDIFATFSGISATFSGTIASFVQRYLLFTFSAPPFLPPQSPRRCILLPLIIIHNDEEKVMCLIAWSG